MFATRVLGLLSENGNVCPFSLSLSIPHFPPISFGLCPQMCIPCLAGPANIYTRDSTLLKEVYRNLHLAQPLPGYSRERLSFQQSLMKEYDPLRRLKLEQECKSRNMNVTCGSRWIGTWCNSRPYGFVIASYPVSKNWGQSIPKLLLRSTAPMKGGKL